MSVSDTFVKKVDGLSKWTGEWIGWLIFIDVFAIAYDVLNRYILGKATDWGYDVGWMLFGVSFMIGAAYTLQERKHVRVDLLYERFSLRTQAAMDFVFWIVFILPMCVFLTIYGIDYFIRSLEILERSSYSPWRPYIFPLKTIIPITFVLLGLQAIADCIRNLRKMMGKENIDEP